MTQIEQIEMGPGIRIAVATENFHTITRHAGRCRRFIVFEAERARGLREVGRLELPKEQSMHEFTGGGPHPLDGMRALIVKSAGPAFVRRMAARGVETIVTSESDPPSAAAQYFAGALPELPGPHALYATDGNGEAVEFLKAMANESRLAILCKLLLGEKSVSTLERALHMRQSNVSQQLARLRRAGLVSARPSGTTTYYGLASLQVRMVVAAVYEAHCARSGKRERSGTHWS